MAQALTTFFICFTISNSFCQHFVRGIIISGDKQTEGFIYFNPVRHKDRILFKDLRNSKPKEVSTKEIQSFALTDYKQQYDAIKDSLGNDIFSCALIKGAASLYKVEDRYVVKKLSSPDFLLLPKVPHEVRRDREDLKKMRQIFKIKTYLGDSSRVYYTSVVSSITVKKYIEDFNRRNGNTGSAVSARRPRLIFGAFVGLNSSSMSFSGSNSTPKYLREAVFTPQTSYLMGVGFHPNSSYFNRTSLNLELFYSYVQYVGHATYSNIGTVASNDLAISMSSIRMPVSVRFYFRPAHDGFFINPGVSVYLAKVHSATAKGYESLPNGIIINPYEESDIFSGVSQKTIKKTAFLGIGWSKYLGLKTKATLLFRSEYDFGIFDASNKMDVSQTIINNQLLLGFNF